LFNILKNVLFSFLLLFITACGPSDSNYVYDSNYVPPESNNSSNDQSNKFKGVVVDGYIKNSTVCLDLNEDGTCNENETSDTTDTNGLFSLKKPTLDPHVPVVVLSSGGIDTSTQKDFTEKFKMVFDSSSLDQNLSYIISPITDLVARHYANAQGENLLDLNDSKSVISDLLEITLAQIDSDPMKNIDIFAISQDLQHTKHLIQKLMQKNMATLNANEQEELQNKIKTELLEQNLNIERSIIALALKLAIDIPKNEKDFVVAQTQELKNTLNSLSKDTSLSVENLNRLQKSLDIKQDEVYTLLNNADENSVLEVVKLDITTESLTQTIFNTTNAILDEKACNSQSIFNEITTYSFMPDPSADDFNGMSIKSTYPFGEGLDETKVTIYYPSLQNDQTKNKVVLFEDDYYFAYDIAWVNNTNKTVYVKTPKDERGLYSCYRYELNSTSAGDITSTKVFSYSELQG